MNAKSRGNSQIVKYINGHRRSKESESILSGIICFFCILFSICYIIVLCVQYSNSLLNRDIVLIQCTNCSSTKRTDNYLHLKKKNKGPPQPAPTCPHRLTYPTRHTPHNSACSSVASSAVVPAPSAQRLTKGRAAAPADVAAEASRCGGGSTAAGAGVERSVRWESMGRMGVWR